MLKKGAVETVNYELGTVTVYIKDLDVTTEELTVLQGRTYQEKDYSMPYVGEEGWCIIEPNSYDGVYLGGGYGYSNTPPSGAGKGINIKEFLDGTKIIYDSNQKQMNIDCCNDLNLIVNNNLNGYVGTQIGITTPTTNLDTELTVTKKIKSLVDVVIGSLSLLFHIHKDGDNKDTSPPM